MVLVQIQHPGAAAFPYFAGTYVPVKPGEVKTVTVVLAANQGLEGSFKIQGGQQDLVFSVSDPYGNTVVSAGKVYGSHTFAFTARRQGHINYALTTASLLTQANSSHLSYPTNPAVNGGGEHLPNSPSPPRRRGPRPGQPSPPSRW